MAATVPPPRRSRRSSGAVTLHDVAKLAGVAPITASRAVNTPDQVSEAVRTKVADAIARTGYVPNFLAGGLASHRSRLVAAVVPTISGPVFLQTVQSLTAALAESGYQLMLGQSGYSSDREDDLLGAIIGRRPDGIVLTGIMHSAEGRRRLAVISGSDERAKRRQVAFQAAARGLGLDDPRVVVVPAPTTLRSGRAALVELMRGGARPDAVFCSSDLLALGVMTQARAAAVAVPKRLAIVGFGDLEFAADLQPALTTVRIDGGAIGRQASRFIVDRAAGRAIGQRVVDIGFAIVERDTT